MFAPHARRSRAGLVAAVRGHGHVDLTSRIDQRAMRAGARPRWRGSRMAPTLTMMSFSISVVLSRSMRASSVLGSDGRGFRDCNYQ
jgi:hypothetical protein